MGEDFQEGRLCHLVVLGFYYGSYMDPDVLRRFGADPQAPRRATLPGWRLAFSPHADMVRDPVGTVEGVVYDLPQDELDRLYGPNGFVTTYRPVPVVLADGQEVISFIAGGVEAPPDPEYAAGLFAIMERVGLPPEYIAQVSQ